LCPGFARTGGIEDGVGARAVGAFGRRGRAAGGSGSEEATFGEAEYLAAMLSPGIGARADGAGRDFVEA
jgi:hypothetical protein